MNTTSIHDGNRAFTNALSPFVYDESSMITPGHQSAIDSGYQSRQPRYTSFLSNNVGLDSGFIFGLGPQPVTFDPCVRPAASFPGSGACPLPTGPTSASQGSAQQHPFNGNIGVESDTVSNGRSPFYRNRRARMSWHSHQMTGRSSCGRSSEDTQKFDEVCSTILLFTF